MAKPFEGVIGRTFDDSTPWWPPLPQPPLGDESPNVVIVLLDDVGYAQFGCYGSDIATPTFDRLAANGLRYSNFHTTALCSPTRAALLTGRNHHANGMARIVEFPSGFPGYDATIPPTSGYLSQILSQQGYATFAVGKWHLTPAHEMAPGGPRDHWPTRKGFDRFYGFLAGETDQYHPDLVADGEQVWPPTTPDEGYHLTEDLADKAIGFVDDLRAYSNTKPFLLWFAPGACHAPHQAPASSIEPYRGRFDLGWDEWRAGVFERQQRSGLLPAGTELSDRPTWVPAWESLTDDERRLYARMMEVYAGFLTHTDAQVGRVLDHLERIGELDDTLVIVMSDNGASAEGGRTGTFNEAYFFNFVPESLEENLRRIDDLGGPHANNHYPWGWAWAGNTPLKRFKRDTHEGGVCDPLIVSWPSRLGSPGETRHQYVHAVDVTPTVLDLLRIDPPATIEGVEQTPFDGASFAPTLSDAAAPPPRTTQYYEMLGSRALYHVAEDFSEVHDLAADEPGKLRELQERWWDEAERNQVLPLNNQPGRFGDRRFRKDRYVYRAGVGSIPETMAPNLRNRAWTITATLRVPGDADAPTDGIVVGHGGHSGGYALYLAGRRLHYVNNLLGAEITTVDAEVELPAGEQVVSATFTPTGRFAGDVELR
jgi:arylsulfatase